MWSALAAALTSWSPLPAAVRPFFRASRLSLTTPSQEATRSPLHSWTLICLEAASTRLLYFKTFAACVFFFFITAVEAAQYSCQAVSKQCKFCAHLALLLCSLALIVVCVCVWERDVYYLSLCSFCFTFAWTVAALLVGAVKRRKKNGGMHLKRRHKPTILSNKEKNILFGALLWDLWFRCVSGSWREPGCFHPSDYFWLSFTATALQGGSRRTLPPCSRCSPPAVIYPLLSQYY